MPKRTGPRLLRGTTKSVEASRMEDLTRYAMSGHCCEYHAEGGDPSFRCGRDAPANKALTVEEP